MCYLRCPACRGPLVDVDPLRCARCHRSYPVVDGIPALLIAPVETEEMRRKLAEVRRQMIAYPAFLAAMAVLGPAWIPRERRRIIERAGLRPGMTVLDHCTGPGSNLQAIASSVGPAGRIVAMDLLPTMARRARDLARRKAIAADVQQADALALPYADGYFDAVVHCGTVNQFGAGKRRTIDEMLRVTREGGTIVIVDEGVRRPESWRGRLLTRRNSLFESRPPVDLVSNGADVHLDWIMGDLFWQLQFRKPRGWTLRTDRQ
jgi:SAM-dependent methyltransferase